MKAFHILDMSCDHCKETVEKTIKTLDPQAHIDFDMDARQIRLDSQAAIETLTAALSKAGYPATPA
jgi:copper chaperone